MLDPDILGLDGYYVRCGDQYISCYDPSTGEVEWTTDTQFLAVWYNENEAYAVARTIGGATVIDDEQFREMI